MIINRYNFLRWSNDTISFSSDGDFVSEDFDSDDFAVISSTPSSGLEADDVGELPRPYLVDRERCGYMPVLVDGDVMGFYINTANGVDYATFSDLRLKIVNAASGGVAAVGFATLYQDVLTGTNYNIYAYFVVPTLTAGLYRFQIYRDSDDSVLLTSNTLIARTDADVLNQTLTAKFRNDRYFYHVRSIPGVYQQFRLNMAMLERQYENDKDVYKEVTTGKIRTFNNFMQRYLKFETYYFDPPAHEAAAIMIENSYVEFNGLRFRAKSPYKEAAVLQSKIGKGEFEMYDESYGTVNRCTVNAVMELGDGSGGVIGDGSGGIIGFGG